jgi:superfamily II DNA or RNA helicase
MLTRNGYKLPKNQDTENLRKLLTVKPYVPPVFVRPQYVKPYRVYHETESFIYLPKQFGIARYGLPELCTFTVTAGSPEHWDFKGSLRDHQLGVVGTYLHPAPHDGMICLQTGGGKTVCALYIASVLRVKTLIVVHNTFLKDQWEERIKSFLPSARIGRIQGEITDVAEKDIIIAMIQSISMKEYPKEVFAGIGLTIVDECHHIASEVFVRAFPKITAKHMLGLSATPDRKDGLMYVIEWFLGPILFKSDNADKEDSAVRVEVFNHEPDDVHFNTVVYNSQGVMSSANMINKLAEFAPRTKLIASILEDILVDGRQILVMSDRVQHCKDILEALSPSLQEQACIIAQSVPAPKRAEWCSTKKILIATYSMCKEGFDVSTLNTLVMATPRPDIDQIVGRILRTEKEKRTIHPLIVDIVDSTFRRQFQQRLTLYKKRMYTVDIMEIT